MWFSQTTPDKPPPTPPPWRYPAFITLRTPTAFQVVWGRRCDVLFRSSYVLERTLTAGAHYPSISVVANKMHIQKKCGHLNLLYVFDKRDLYRVLLSQAVA